MIELDVAALGRQAEHMIETLGRVSAEPSRLTRLYLTPEHRTAMDLVAGWMVDAGMTVTEDGAATVRGALAGPAGRSRLAMGSHLDTVIDAGRYDGALGVVAAIIAVEVLCGSGVALPFGVDVLAFGEEEGSRFPTTLAGSSVAAGIFDRGQLDLVDADGVTVEEALTAFGKDPVTLAHAAYRRDELIAYVEVHIEQGPVLEHEALPLGIVTSIAGQSRQRVTVSGMAGHAGTVPMRLRSDALLAAGEMALALERIARAGEAYAMVGTVGTVHVAPGAPNVIPAEVSFSVDLRASADAPRLAALAAFDAEARAIAEARGCTLSVQPYLDVRTTPAAGWVQDGLEAAVRSLGLGARRLLSGAGHDGMAMAKVADIGMLFVRCRGGISHNPLEYAAPDDMGYAVAALVRFIEALAKGEAGPA